jgi:hypothetical protein
MSNIYECEKIKSRIENHSHYGPCFNDYVYHTFCNKRDVLSNCRNCYDNLNRVKNELIDYDYKIKNLEQEIQNLQIRNEKRIENTKDNYRYEENEKSQEYDNEIERLTHIKENYEKDKENKLKLLDQDISNLKIEIDKLKSKYENEVDYKKKYILNEITNEYKIKLIKYQNEKEREKEKKIAEKEIREEEFKAKKDYEKNDMKNKAAMAQKLIVIFKNLLSNN